MSSSADSTKLTDDVKAYFAGWRVEEGKYDVDSGMPEFPVSHVVRGGVLNDAAISCCT
jgi:hypothetical protein